GTISESGFLDWRADFGAYVWRRLTVRNKMQDPKQRIRCEGGAYISGEWRRRPSAGLLFPAFSLPAFSARQDRCPSSERPNRSSLQRSGPARSGPAAPHPWRATWPPFHLPEQRRPELLSIGLVPQPFFRTRAPEFQRWQLRLRAWALAAKPTA